MGYDPDRFDHVDDFWLCKVCHHILQNPILICASDHFACRACVPAAAACPWPDCDKTVFDADFKRELNVARFIDTLNISCEQCDWRGPVADEAEHTVNCASRQVHCPNANCTAVVSFCDLTAHLGACPSGLVSCANSPACAKLIGRAEVSEHLSSCEFNPCCWQTSGCTFRGSVAAIAAHEEYCTPLHEEIIRLRGVEKAFKKAEKAKKREERRAARAAAQDQTEATGEVDEEDKIKRREERRAARAAARAQTDAEAEAETEREKEKKAERRRQRKADRVAKRKGDFNKTMSTHGTMALPKVALTTQPNEIMPDHEASNLYPLPSPANSTEGKRTSRGTTSPRETKHTVSGLDVDSIASSCDSSPACVKSAAASVDNFAAAHRDSSTANPTRRTPAIDHNPPLMKKRSPDDNIANSGGPKRKKLRIRLPSPFLQSDIDEDISDAERDGKDQLDFTAETEIAPSDTASEELDDLLVTPIPGCTKLAEEGEVEESVTVSDGLTPTPASLLAKYQASQPLYTQPHFHSDSRFRPGVLSQQYLDFPLTDIAHQYPLNNIPDGYDRGSMSVSPVLRSSV